MRLTWVVVAAALACACKSEKPKSEQQQRLERLRQPGLVDGQIVHMSCELAKDLAKDEEIRNALMARFYDRVERDTDAGDLKCIMDAYSAWYVDTNQQSLNAKAIVRAWEHHKIQSAKVVYDKMSANVIADSRGVPPDAGKAWDAPIIVEEISAKLAELDASLKGYMKADDAPMDQRTPNDIPLYTGTVDRVAAVGAPAVPQLVDIWLTEAQPIKIRAAAQALGLIDPATLTKETIKALDDYDAAFLKEPISRMKGSAAAAGVHAALSYRTPRALDVLLRALSSPDSAASGGAAKWIQEHLDAEKAIDALFRYMAAKSKYSVREIDVYVDVITSFKNAASPIVAKNLEALLAAAKSPKKVFWAHKVVAMTALQRIGTKDATPTVQKFVADPGSYQSMPIPKDPNDPLEGMAETKTITFKSLAEETLAAIEKR